MIYAPEIECALVSTLWHRPELCAHFLRRCDPLLHIFQPHLRIVVEAINTSWGELNTSDFATVVELVRASGAFEECGALEGLNSLYSLRSRSLCRACDTLQGQERIFDYYCSLLSQYARRRALPPPIRPVYGLAGGRGTLYPNKAKRAKWDADFTGSVRLAGKLYSAALWTQPDFFNIKLEP